MLMKTNNTKIILKKRDPVPIYKGICHSRRSLRNEKIEKRDIDVKILCPLNILFIPVENPKTDVQQYKPRVEIYILVLNKLSERANYEFEIERRYIIITIL